MKTGHLLIAILYVFGFYSSDLFCQDLNNSILKIHVVSNDYDYTQPWQKIGSYSSSGSGCVIKGNMILTNAHVISNSTFVQVQFPGEAKKYTAEVKVIGDICDLAVLTVKDKGFNNKVKPIEIGELPKMLDEITVHGFPEGGEELSITKGVISRIEHDEYAHSSASLLACQIDAAVNPGNSGGPVIKNGKVVGIVMQGLDGAQNTNYFIPPNIINHFLKDIEDGAFDGFPSLLVEVSKMENADMRTFYKMQDQHTGILLNKILPNSPCEGILFPNDILLEIDEVRIDNDGKANFRQGERTVADFILQEKYLNDIIKCKILRGGTEMIVDIKLTKNMNDELLVPFMEYNTQPTYYITGGFIFQPLTMNYMDASWKNWTSAAPANLLNYYFFKAPTIDINELVVLTMVLADELNEGYLDYGSYTIIKEVNGKKIKNLKELVSAVENNSSDYHVFITEGDNQIILDRKKVNERNKAILDAYGIVSDRSPNLKTKK